MDITTEAGALFDNQPRRINKISLLDITIVNPCASSYLDNAARHAGHHFGDAVERKKNKYRGSFSANNSFLSQAMSTCGEVGSDAHALIKELAIRRGGHRSEKRSNEPQHLAQETEVARLRRRFSFVLQQALLIRTRYHLCKQGVALAGTRQLRSQGPVSVHAPTVPSPGDGKERTGSGAESESGTGSKMGTGSEKGKGDVKADGDGDGDGAGRRTHTHTHRINASGIE